MTALRQDCHRTIFFARSLTYQAISYTLCEPAEAGLVLEFDLLRTTNYVLRTIAMTRSLKKGPYVDVKLMKKVSLRKATQGVIKTWARSSQIAPEFVGYTFGVHTGKNFDDVFVTEDMVGHRLGEFAPTTKFIKHGGKMQKETEMAAKAAEIATAQAAKATASAAPAKK